MLSVLLNCSFLNVTSGFSNGYSICFFNSGTYYFNELLLSSLMQMKYYLSESKKNLKIPKG